MKSVSSSSTIDIRWLVVFTMSAGLLRLARLYHPVMSIFRRARRSQAVGLLISLGAVTCACAQGSGSSNVITGLTVTSLNLTGALNKVTLQYSLLAGYDHYVEFQDQLPGSTSWQMFPGGPHNGGVYSDLNDVPKRFYRIRAVIAPVLRVPPLGMDTWYFAGVNHGDTLIRTYVDIASTNGLVALGWKYISITEGWQGGRTNGVLMPDGAKYPNITNTIAYVHARGMKVRIYTEPAALTSAQLPGTPPVFFENDIRAFAAWGVDDIQFDVISPPYDNEGKLNTLREFVDTIRRVAPRPMTVYSGGFRSPLIGGSAFSNFNAFELSSVANSWRAVGDLGPGYPAGEHNTWTNYIDEFIGSALEVADTMRPDRWYQIDHVHLMGGSAAATNLSRGTFAMNAMMSSPIFVPLFAGPNQDMFRYSVLTNRTLLRIQQDSLGAPGQVVVSNATHRVFVKQLDDGSKAVALMNHVTNAATGVTFSAAELGWPSDTPLYYVSAWHGTNGFWTNTLTHVVPPMTADLFHIWRTNAVLAGFPISSGSVTLANSADENRN